MTHTARIQARAEAEAEAARIANTSRKKAGKKGGKHPEYEEWTREQLYEKAQQIGIEGRSDMDKDDLIKALRSH
mgnify:CR=1 FL=1